MKLYHFLLLGFGILFFLFCAREPSPESPPFKNLAADVAYVGMETCKSCHANIHETFVHTGMGRSFDHGTKAKSDATFGEHALVYDEKSDFYYFPYLKNQTLYVKEFRLGPGGDTLHRRDERISYIVGSGQHTNSHIVDFNGYIYQAPITFYTQKGTWDMAPGFREGTNLRFSRLLSSECITCHNHYPTLETGSLNKFSDMPTGIECERCHGPGEIHVKEKLAGEVIDTSQFPDYSIVNPRRLSRDLQMDLCQRCHLQGVAVLEPGKTFYDFKPGMQLQDVMNVFLPRYTNSHARFIMASQADRLRQSACYTQSEMTCLTCHNPHVSVAETGMQQYNAACQDCHQQKGCTAPMSDRQAEEDNCSGCHMPVSGSTDIPHVSITDHYISKQNIKGRASAAPGEEAAFLGLQILTKETGSALEMARGYLALYDKFVTAPIMLDSARYYLDKVEGTSPLILQTRIHHLFAKRDFQSLVQIAAQLPPSGIEDAWTLYRIGEAYAQTGSPDQARFFLEKAVAKMPLHLDFLEKYGAVQVSLQQFSQAEETFENILELNPNRSVALSNLGYLKALQGQFKTAESYYDQALDLEPDYEQALLNKAAVRLQANDQQTAKALLEKVIDINPINEQASQVLEQLQ